MDVKCSFCKRKMKITEEFGSGDKDWDEPGIICPECFEGITSLALGEL